MLRDKVAEIVRYFEDSGECAYKSMLDYGGPCTTAIYVPYDDMFGIKIFAGDCAKKCMLNQRTAALAKIGPCILFAKTVKLPCGESVVVTIVEHVKVAGDMTREKREPLIKELFAIRANAYSMKWMDATFLKDLHSDNWGTIRDRVVILDFGL